MEIIRKDINGLDVVFLKTNKFKSMCGCLYFKSLVTEEKLTSYNLLTKILVSSTKKYNTEEKLNLNILENYSPDYSSGNLRYGNYIISSFYFEVLCDKYTSSGNLKKVVNTFNEIVFNPNVENNEFNKEEFDVCYNELLTSLDRIKERQVSYSSYRLTELLNNNKAYSYREKKEVLEKITPKSLYETYLDMLNDSEITLIIVGDVDESDDVFNSIISNIKYNKKYNNKLIISNDDEDNNLKEIIEEGTGSENIFRMVCYLKNMSNYELNYVIPIYRYILGGGANSRLFKEVREKKSLAYYIYSNYYKDDSMITITTGVEKENYKKALSIIKKEIEDMKNIKEDEIINAKKYLTSSLATSVDYLDNLVSRYHYEKLYDLPLLDEYISILNKVTLEEVINVSKKVNPALVYFLKGSDVDE